MSHSGQRKWKGCVDQMLYGAKLQRPVPEELVSHLASELIRQRFFSNPVKCYYDAALEAVASDELLAIDPTQEESAVRDLLARLIPVLDERRPWPEPGFQKTDIPTRLRLDEIPVVGHIPLTGRDVEVRLHRNFHEIETPTGKASVLSLRLRSGQDVFLVGHRPFNQVGIALRTLSDPATTISDFRDLTGIEVSD